MSEKKQGGIKRNVVTLLTGTVLAQALPVGISPVLSRLYSPDDFGLLALYAALASIIATVASLRYELAILQPEDEEDAIALVWISLAAIGIVFSITLLAVFSYNHFKLEFLGVEGIRGWLYLLPLSVLVLGVFKIFNRWLLRNDAYKAISQVTVSQSLFSSFFQVALSLFSLKGGLVIGQFVGQTAASLVAGFKSARKVRSFSLNINKERMLFNIKKYRRMPTYSTAGALADMLSIQMPVLVISRFFLESATGAFSLTFRVLNLPATVVSSAVSQVLYKRINDMSNANSMGITQLLFKLFILNLGLMAPFIIFVNLFGEQLFALIFGEPWRQAGKMATVLVFAVAVRFVVSPMSAVLAIEKNIKLGTLWQFLYLVTIFMTLFYFRESSIEVFILAFVVHEIIQYMVYFGLIIKGARRLERNG
ncbi:oligosaccharide flippase family protein [uncultured Endozoicomonas sp.]|uniref:lipopolysaccharide biosynthesis protein n=1 Tax=uncultured Endozoicomonas sp. TaxID=432652 RepID=UPI00261F27E6|nr:oligosaccharide flippase family protein [uncultured Endozoicomonas sp.]